MSMFGLDDILAPGWIDIQHFFIAPFYVISYCISNDAALQIYQAELKDGSGLDVYRGLMSRSADNNPVLVRRLTETAAKAGIPCQMTAAHRATGGTDAARIQLNRAGVATALISIPNRYMHSQVEMCDLRDAEGAVAVLTETIAALTGKESFVPVR